MFGFETSECNLKWALFRFHNCYAIKETIEEDGDSMGSLGTLSQYLKKC